jgi:hypothetical protein
MTDESKAERQNGVQQYVSSELENLKRDVLVSYHSTSIYDHSALEAFSKVNNSFLTINDNSYYYC